MNTKIFPIICCPDCQKPGLKGTCFTKSGDEMRSGVVVCPTCHQWYPVINGVLDLLRGQLAYPRKRKRFWKSHQKSLVKLGLKFESTATRQADRGQAKQQQHSDWFGDNDILTYSKFEQSNFWQTVDQTIFRGWKDLINTNSLLLDVGCAQGRSTFKFADKSITIVAVDISQKLIHEAKLRYHAKKWSAKVNFILADLTTFPFVSNSFDCVLVYGVLHHLPSPTKAIGEIVRVLKNGGWYFGNENNDTIFRTIFDWLQKIRPQWHEEAGPEPLISESTIRKAFNNKFKLEIKSIVYLPPHLFNLLPIFLSKPIYRLSDLIGSTIPKIKNNGGLLLIQGQKR